MTYVAIGLINPKTEPNVGGAMRAAGCFGAALVLVQGARYRPMLTDTTAAWRHIPLLQVPSLLDAVPRDCVPIAVELSDDAKPLETFPHPPRALYIFGPEDGGVPTEVQRRCRDVLRIGSRHCLNLAASVNVVLYDRAAKVFRRREVAP